MCRIATFVCRIGILNNQPTLKGQSMEKLDRDLEKKILETAFKAYPRPISFSDICGSSEREDEFMAEVKYLSEHRLIKVDIKANLNSYMVIASPIYITKDGIDFLQNDGGLSAILGVVTIKIHDDTIKKLVSEKILASDLPQPQKQKFLDQLRSLPAESTKHLVMKLVDAGLENTPKLLPLLQSLLG